MKLGIRGCSESLVTNLNSKVRNIKWRIQYGGPKLKKLVDPDKTRYSEAFEVAGDESDSKFRKFKMPDPVWLTKMRKLCRFG